MYKSFACVYLEPSGHWLWLDQR